jgi:hypothetical protein
MAGIEFATTYINTIYKNGKAADKAASTLLVSVEISLEDVLMALEMSSLNEEKSEELMKALMKVKSSTASGVKTTPLCAAAAPVVNTVKSTGLEKPESLHSVELKLNCADTKSSAPAGASTTTVTEDIPWGDIGMDAVNLPKISRKIFVEDLFKATAAAAAPAPSSSAHVGGGGAGAGATASAPVSKTDEEDDTISLDTSVEGLTEALYYMIVDSNNGKKPYTLKVLHKWLITTRKEHHTKPGYGFIGSNFHLLSDWAISCGYMEEDDRFDKSNPDWNKLCQAAKNVVLKLLKDPSVNHALARDWASWHGGRGTRLDFSEFESSNAVKLCD